MKTTFLIREPYYWPVALGHEEADYVNEHMREHGVDVRLEEEMTEIHVDDSGRVCGVTTNKDERLDWALEEPIGAADLTRNADGAIALQRNPASRFSFIRRGEDSVMLFVDGRSCLCTGPAATVAKRICNAAAFEVDAEQMDDPAIAELIVDLVNRGCLAPLDFD